MGSKEFGVTTNQIVLLYLYETSPLIEKGPVPDILTQKGIARELAIPRGYVSFILTQLITRGLCTISLSHIKGERRKQTIYTLTLEGCTAGKELLKEMSSIETAFRKEDVLTGGPLSRICKQLDISISKFISLSGHDKVLDLGSLIPAPSQGIVPDSPESPMDFVGRRNELRIGNEWIEGKAPLLYIYGLAGEGKTAVLSKMIDFWKEKGYQVLYHRIIGPDTDTILVYKLAGLLNKADKRNLNDLLKEKVRISLDELRTVLCTDLEGEKVVLAIDDLHRIKDRSKRIHLLETLIDLGEKGLRSVAVSRERMPLYDPRKTIIYGTVMEHHLKGLEEEDVKEFLTKAGVLDWEPVKDLTKGHPLFLRLCKHLHENGSMADPRSTMEGFLAAEVLGKLTTREMNALEVLSMFRTDVTSREALDLDIKERFFSVEDINGLSDRGLIEPVGSTLKVHDLVREMALGSIDGNASIELHRILAQHYHEILTMGSTPASGDPETISRRISGFNELFHHLSFSISNPSDLFNIIHDHGEELISLSELDLILDATEGPLRNTTQLKGSMDLEVLCTVLLWNGLCNHLRGRSDKAMSRYEQALTLASEDIRLQELRGRCINALGTVHLIKGEFEKARELVLAGLENLRRPEDISKARSNLAIIEWRLGDLDKALEQIDIALNTSRGLDDPVGIARCSINKGIILWQKGELDRALEVYNQALDLCIRNRYLQMSASVHDNIGELLRSRGDKNGAMAHFDESIRIAQSIGFCSQAAESTRNVALLENDRDKKNVLLVKAVTLFEQMGNGPEAKRTRDLLKDC